MLWLILTIDMHSRVNIIDGDRAPQEEEEKRGPRGRSIKRSMGLILNGLGRRQEHQLELNK